MNPADHPGPATGRPKFSVDALAALLDERFGLTGELTVLPSYSDQTAAVVTQSGARFVLKLHRAGESRELVAQQQRAMVTLADAGLPVPAVQPDRHGERLGEVPGTAGTAHLVQLVSWLEGRLLADVRPRGDALLTDLGRVLGRLDRALLDADLPPLHQDIPWSLSAAAPALDAGQSFIADAGLRARLQRLRDEAEQVSRLGLRTGLVHNDANDRNLLVDDALARPRITGVIDFGDMLTGPLVGEAAVASAYALMDHPDPVLGLATLGAGYHAALPLHDHERDALLPLTRLRLGLSLANAARSAAAEPDNDYLEVSAAPARALLERLDGEHPPECAAALRHACGLPAAPIRVAFDAWCTRLPVRAELLPDAPVESWSDHDPSPAGDALDAAPSCTPACSPPGARWTGAGGLERPSWQPARELAVPPGVAVHAPLDGELVDDPACAHGLLLRCRPEAHGPFVLRIDGLAPDGRAHPGPVLAGARLGESAAARPGDGDLARLSVRVDLGAPSPRGPGLCPADRAAALSAVHPDPAPLLGWSLDHDAPPPPTTEALLARRAARFGGSLSLSYRRPLHIVRGRGAWLVDAQGRRFVDGVNNVACVGHAHPRVVAAAHRQKSRLETNSRYLQELPLAYAERLAGLFDDGLEVVYLVSSGSEANELALRLARAATGRHAAVVLDHAYHGHSAALIDLSPYKHDGPGGSGAPDWVHVAPCPDGYRGLHRGGDAVTGRAYVAELAATLEQAVDAGHAPAAVFLEALPGCGGQIVPPDGFLTGAVAAARAAGAVCVIDEVQTGFGRVGPALWAHRLQGATPDVVTLGKPMGNGHPLAAVVTTREIAERFDDGMEWFATFGGNAVSCAVGMAVLDVIEDEGLARHAADQGARLLDELTALTRDHPHVGDVRGRGLYLGLELVRDRDARTPFAAAAAHVVERCRELGVLLSTDGPDHNVIKLKPPLVFGDDERGRTLEALASALDDSCLRRGVARPNGAVSASA